MKLHEVHVLVRCHDVLGDQVIILGIVPSQVLLARLNIEAPHCDDGVYW